MWGHIVTEATFEANFNTQFPNTKSDILIHLAQWQYWWWFWFSFLWVLYFLFLARTLRYRTLKFRPKIVSSFRPHGKWGDLIICVLPISWCANILINSNFLLKLLEWQAESSLFTIRIRGKQWYWVYKFDFRNFSDIASTPKNVGNNKWLFSFFGDLKTSDNYLHILQMRAQNKSIKKYWIKNLSKFEQDEKSNINLAQEVFKVDSVDHSNENTNPSSYGGGSGDNDDKNPQKSKSSSSTSSTNCNADNKAGVCENNEPLFANPYSFRIRYGVGLPAWWGTPYYNIGVGAKFFNVRTRKFEYVPVSAGMRTDGHVGYDEHEPGTRLLRNRVISQYFDSIEDGRFVSSEEKLLRGDVFGYEHFLSIKRTVSPQPRFDFSTIFSGKNALRYVHWSRGGESLFKEILPEPFIFSFFGKGFLKPSCVLLVPTSAGFPYESAVLAIINSYRKYPITFYELYPSYRYALKPQFSYLSHPSDNGGFGGGNNPLGKLKLFPYGWPIKGMESRYRICYKDSISYSPNSSEVSYRDCYPLFNQYNIFAAQDETIRVSKPVFGKPVPLAIVKLPVEYVENANFRLFKLRYNDKNSKFTSRNMVKIPYFVFKQVKYKRRTEFVSSHTTSHVSGESRLIKKGFSLNNQYSVEHENATTARRYYRMLRKNRVRSEVMPVVVAKRLLRVKRTLVIPTHINITAITNSYDVVHSWFIPGLGLKMDCVPGRSTHHTFYVDNAGFYYGQCAEICGRFHHHMPIRVCALPFEHFLIWWHRIALPQLLHPNKKYTALKAQSFREFVW